VDWIHLTAGSCEYNNEQFSSIKGKKFVDWPSDYYFSRRTLLYGVSQVSRQAGRWVGGRVGGQAGRQVQLSDRSI
jgi:hypothetical protein